MDMADAGGDVPLQTHQIVDVIERWEGDNEVRVPGGACWHCGSVAPPLRHAQAKKGFVEAVAPWLVVGRDAILPLGCIVDAWGGEPIPPPQAEAPLTSRRHP